MFLEKVTTLSKRLSKTVQRLTAFLFPPAPSTAIVPRSLNENLHEIFQPSAMARLPFELRVKIWKYYLDETPQLYRFNLRYPYRGSVCDSSIRDVQAGDHLILQPVQCILNNDQTRDSPEKCFLQPLRDVMKTRRTASMTCLESRQVVLDMYPDTLTFRILSGRWPSGTDPLDGTGFVKCTLRFDGSKDIFIFNSCWQDLDATLQIAKLKGSGPADFLTMRHVGIALNDLRSSVRYRYGRPAYGTNKCLDNCATEACRDHCQYDPLPAFLSLFPLLERFYIAAVPSSSTHQLENQFQAGTWPSAEANCPCPIEEMRHTWQVIWNNQACGWSMIYDERSSCPFPRFSRVEVLRQRWRPHFPYYQVLNHLEIRFIQPLMPNCNDCVYTL